VSDAFWVSLFGFLGVAFTGMLTMLTVIYQQNKKVMAKVEENAEAMNGHLEKLVKQTDTIARAQGKLEGIAEQKERDDV